MHPGYVPSATMKTTSAKTSRASVIGRLGALKSRGVPESDERVRECRENLEILAVRDELDRAARVLPGPVLDQLLADLRESAVAS